MVAHSALTGANLHEPKGVASATVGTVYKADGAGSGSWTTIDNNSVPTGFPVQVVATNYTTFLNLSTTIPYDDTVPQNTEGTEIMTVSITPKSTTNKLLVRAVIQCGSVNAAVVLGAHFQDSTASALAAAACGFDGTDNESMATMVIEHWMTAGTTSSTTFKVRVGEETGTSGYINGANGARKFGGVSTCTLTVTEYKAS